MFFVEYLNTHTLVWIFSIIIVLVHGYAYQQCVRQKKKEGQLLLIGILIWVLTGCCLLVVAGPTLYEV